MEFLHSSSCRGVCTEPCFNVNNTNEKILEYDWIIKNNSLHEQLCGLYYTKISSIFFHIISNNNNFLYKKNFD